jgi:predicted secreted hydrolase
VLGLLALACSEPQEPTRASLSVSGALRASDEQGYARAIEPREFRFPQDHGPHPEFRTEWWYYTGNLSTREGRRFGFQLTFFRSALAPSMPARRSDWASRQAWLAHFALSDVDAPESLRFRSFERWSRGALGLAGANAEPFRLWLRDWTADATGPATSGTPPMRLRADQDGAGLDLRLQPGKPPVLEGDHGLSRKSDEVGNASYYYSLPRMPAEGTIRAGGQRFPVTGLVWMDREWSTSALGRDQVGWDWFALHLDDGSDLMLYRLRRRDGGVDPSSSGTVIAQDGASRPLRRDGFELTPSGSWRSPRSSASYPERWTVRIPSEEMDLEVRPLLADQELDVTFRYWEGAVSVEGTRHGRLVHGRGYLEMTGYGEPQDKVGSRP